jgi:plastocyanin
VSKRALGGGLLTAIAALAIAIAFTSGVAADERSGAEAAGKKVAKVKVGDDYFSPVDLKVKKGTKVKWKWLPENGNPHNVTFRKGPKSLKKKEKKKLRKLDLCTGALCDPVKATLKKKGKYKFICTIHPTTMVQTIKVSKKG